MYYWAIPATFASLSGLYLLLLHIGGPYADKACARVSLVHHFVAMLLGLYVHAKYAHRLEEDAAFGSNHLYPEAVLLQHFNIGYFLYDSIHVWVWDQKFVVHHMVALCGYGTSELANVFALANAVNTWITEAGSVMYSSFLLVKTDAAYAAFVIAYAVSRSYFAYWSFLVLQQVRQALTAPLPQWSYPVWAPYDAAALQLMLFAINALFLWTHTRKLLQKLTSKKGAKEEGKKE
mmetsp:Transcript_35648/g.80495  ORF Transcript_35648/g.80495 Transcript_35648/m.80495 type:complete len:234 (+) Transcript_35648:156-857(+)